MAVGEWDQRQLCSDGGCVGVIGPDGTCKVCGRAAQNWGDERTRGLLEPADEAEDDDEDLVDDQDDAHELDDDELEDDGEDDLDDEDGDDDDLDDDGEPDANAVVAHSAAPALAAAPADWSTRTLCPDGTCIGVIGDDGRCKVCGRRADGSPPVRASGEAPAAGAASGFVIETTEAVATTDDAVQTVASTVATEEPPADPEVPADPDSPAPKDPTR